MKTKEMKVLTLKGTPKERGSVIGETLREDIHAILEKHDDSIAKLPGYDLKNYYSAFDKYNNHYSAIKRWAPDILQEVYSTAKAANVDQKRFLRFQLLDEHWAFDTFHYAPKARVLNKCSTFGVVDEGGLLPTYAGQNLDIPSYIEGHQVLLRIQYPDSDLENLVYTYSGSISLCGMNNSPLGISLNTTMQLGYRPDGLPVVFLVRKLLELSSFDEVVQFLKTVKHASGLTYTLSSPGRIGCFECSPNKVVEYRPKPDGLRVCHTNHPLANNDTADFEELIKTDPHSSWVKVATNTRSRLSSIAARIMNREETIKIEDLKSALRAKDDPENPVCRDMSTDINASSIAYTAGSIIYEMSNKPKFHLAAGPPSESEFITFDFQR